MNVLAIDGGGVRGAVPAAILARWESEGGPSPCDRFGMFAGTSTGAILAGSLAAGRSASSLLELFLNQASEIFTPQKEGWMQRALTFKGIVLPAYSVEPLRRALESQLGDLTLGECPRPLVIASLDVISGNPKVFRSGHFSDCGTDRDVRLVDAILASASAPVLFPSTQVGMSTYVDGALWANNPALMAMLEVRRLDPDAPNILSLGCGRPLWGGKLGFGNNRGLIGWSLPLIPLLMTAQSDGVSLYMRQLMPPDRYLRIDPVFPRHLAPIDKAANVPELIARANEAFRESATALSERFEIGPPRNQQT